MTRQRIVLFSRLELVHLYGHLDRYLSKEMDVIHLAYSDKEADILKEEYGVNVDCLFSERIKHINEYNKSCLVDVNEIDNMIIKESSGRFNLNSALQYDRTLVNEEYELTLNYAQIYYQFWLEFFAEFSCDFLIHEPNAILLTHIASILSSYNNVKYVSTIQVVGKSKYNWLLLEASSGNFISHETNEEIDSILVQEFLSEFRSNYDLVLPCLLKKNTNCNKFIDLLQFILKKSVKSTLSLLLHNRHVDRSLIDSYADKRQKSLFNQVLHKYAYLYHLTYDEIQNEDIFYFYPIHLEPEAVVLYWGDGLYRNQVKLIENIASQLPPNTYLYVKDHPLAGAYRDYIDYERLKTIPNIKLLRPEISGKKLISQSKGVITINGTAGFEALLMNKQVYTFGNIYYNACDRVKHINHVKDLRQILYDNYDTIYEDDNELYRFVDKFLKLSRPGFIAYFLDYAQKARIEPELNAKQVADGIKEILS